MAEVVSMADIEATSLRLGIGISSADLNAIQIPPGEDFGIKSDDDEDLYQEDGFEMEAGFGNIIVVDNLPVVPPEKFEKLENVVRKIYSQIGVIKDVGLWMPVNPETQKTLGYCFIEYNTPQVIIFPLDISFSAKKIVVFSCAYFSDNLFDDFEKYMEVPDEWTPSEIKPYTPGENLQQWLTDEKARDQFVIRFCQWPPLGTYLAAVHRQGAAVWGGATTFNRLMRYAHPQVILIDFSPGEQYLITYSSHARFNRVVLNIFDMRTGKVMRDFKGNADELTTGGSGGVSGVSWPVFRWGGGKEDIYFSRIGKNVISVYETETFTLVDKKSLKVENVVDFSWSPTDPILALFVPELGGGNQPAKVCLVQIPGKEELRQKNLFSVSDCKMYWQSNGEYLAVKVDRYTKTKKSTYTDIPIEVLELDNKNDKIVAFAWEPKGHRFAVIHGDSPRPDISFYSMRTAHNTGRLSKLATLKSKQANALCWSPAGRFILLAGLKGFNGRLDFYNVDELETMATGEHFMATDIEWDPTGRYVATSVTSVHEMENGFHIWSFNGKLLYRIPKDHFCQFLWRPRPPSFLTAEKEEEISKNLKKYSKKYEGDDQDMSLLLSEQERRQRMMLLDEWDAWRENCKRLHEEESELRQQQLRDGEASDEEEEYYETEEVEVEEILDVKEEVVPFDLD
ncbi:hypothetical protein J5N97_001130 [Dioscorea zingiberensis]|uniref:Eukaryotic translation initiation factor 3 subunit B n=1 Tax=Dioscorea zingiberensis TaxID=325984 RepID=A0A9D5BVT1_9LILI|nr:hypothetical protein J5N97_001130 [Dioscorea zingiberensis]